MDQIEKLYKMLDFYLYLLTTLAYFAEEHGGDW